MPHEKSKRPTLHDVAKEAGVSYQSVSRVINDQPGVSDKLRAKIKRIMHDMNDQPNRAAQMLSSQRSQLLEVITTSVFYNYPLASIVNEAETNGYHVMFRSVASNIEKIRELLRGAEARMVDGLILLFIDIRFEDETELFDLCGNVPFVQANAFLGAKTPSVIIDQVAGAQMAVQHLIDLGHTRIAKICGPLSHLDAIMRFEGWRDTLKINELEPGPVIESDFRALGGQSAVTQLLDSGEEFTAVFAGNDDMAFGVLDGLHKHGLRVPEDVSVVGFDNIEISAVARPRLTTVSQRYDELGSLAVEYLLERIANPKAFIHQRVISPELIVRESTSPPRAT